MSVGQMNRVTAILARLGCMSASSETLRVRQNEVAHWQGQSAHAWSDPFYDASGNTVSHDTAFANGQVYCLDAESCRLLSKG
jgi:spermidine/putrescine-binding protein